MVVSKELEEGKCLQTSHKSSRQIQRASDLECDPRRTGSAGSIQLCPPLCCPLENQEHQFTYANL